MLRGAKANERDRSSDVHTVQANVEDRGGSVSGLHLFSGIGGLTLALSEWVTPVAYCERERYAQAVLLSRMADGELPRAPIWDDVTSLRGTMLPSPIDIIYGGFPCQDISSAGHGVGLGGERSGLFNHIARLVSETNPRFIFLENVSAIRTRGLNSVAQTLTELGYDFRWTIVSAKEVGACHVRKRWFGLARAHGLNLRLEPGRSSRQKRQAQTIDGVDGSPRTYPNADGSRLEGQLGSESRVPRPVVYNGWKSQPTVCRRDHGVSGRPHQLKGLGNAVVPLQAQVAFKKLLGNFEYIGEL